eukprot:3888305-Alexandrium_andersonii.AAC.1
MVVVVVGKSPSSASGCFGNLQATRAERAGPSNRGPRSNGRSPSPAAASRTSTRSAGTREPTGGQPAPALRWATVCER